MKLSDYVIQRLYEHGVENFYGYQGGSILHLISSIYSVSNRNTKYIQSYNEQSAAFAAEADARITGNLSVVLATSGPGSTNLVTGIANAYFDSIPVIYITGQVNSGEYKKKPLIRQNSFQEIDIVSMVSNITKYAITVKDPNDIKHIIERACVIAMRDRKGPVLIDIPVDIQAIDIDIKLIQGFHENSINNFDFDENINSIEKFFKAKKPLILLGGGVRLSKSVNKIAEIIENYQIPFVYSLMGIDSYPPMSNLNFGFIGMYGNRYANIAINNCDALLILGSRLDSRQIGKIKEYFAPNALKIIVDIDENENTDIDLNTVRIFMNLTDFISRLHSELIIKKYSNDISKWLVYLNALRRKYPSFLTSYDGEFIDPNFIINEISEMMHHDSVISIDVGQNQMWFAQSHFKKQNQRILTSGGHGAMGFSIPSIIGAFYSKSVSQYICIVGDGGFMMNLQELQTIKRDNIPAKIIVMNNSSLGMVRAPQEKYFDNFLIGTSIGYLPADFGKIAKCFDFDYLKIGKVFNKDELFSCLESPIPSIIEICISDKSQVFPEATPGRPLDDQSPLLSRPEYESNKY